MNDHPADDPAFAEELQLHIPYVPTRSAKTARGGETLTPGASETDWAAGERVRRPPSGMGRRDRREWRTLETVRVQRLRTDEHLTDGASTDSYRGGFITSPPKFLDRRSRKAWLAGEREGSRQWWARRRADTADMAVRERGGLILALLVAALCSWWVIAGLTGSHAAQGASPFSAAQVVPPGSTSSAGPAAVPVASVAVSSSSATATMLARTVGPAGEAGKLGTLDHGWVPAPTGGVAPVPVATTVTPVYPASVKIVPAPTAPISKADTATPQAAMAAWAARMCPSSWRQSYGADQRSVRPLMTDTAWQTMDPTADTTAAGVWRGVVTLRQVRRCGQVTVVASPDQPLSSGNAYVHYEADRVVTSDRPGVAAVVEPVAGQRLVLRQRDGRWLVSRNVIGG